MNLREGVAQLVVQEAEHRAFETMIARVRAETRARAVVLLDTNGQLLAKAGDTADLDITAFASLAASNIAATASMAQLVGEDDFTILFHQGVKDSIHISLVGQRVILAVIFGLEASLGMVRLRTRRAAAELEAVVARVFRRLSAEDRGDLATLGEITEHDIDDLFSF